MFSAPDVKRLASRAVSLDKFSGLYYTKNNEWMTTLSRQHKEYIYGYREKKKQRTRRA